MPMVDERALFIRGPVVVFRWKNAEGWPVEYVSANAREVFGYTPQQFLSGDVVYAELIHPDDLERVGEEVVEGSQNEDGSFVHEPYRIRTASGAIRWLYDMTHVLRPGPEDEPTHFLGYVIDITDHIVAEQERHVLQMKMLDTQKLESLGILAGGVAHDFNNLLTGILGETGLAQRALPPGHDSVARSLGHIESLTLRAADLTRQLLAYAGKGRFCIEPVDMTDLARHLVDILETVVSKKAEVELDLGDVSPIEGDRTQLQQVLMNLLTNASDAIGDQQGTITVVTQDRTLTSDELDAFGAEHLRAGRYVLVRVSDTGSGMTAETQAQLFDPFFTTKVAGRGLGMSAVLGIMRGHEGAIRVESVPGGGTTFELLFHAARERALEPLPAAPTPTLDGQGTVLVVDDEPHVREMAVEFLRHLGFESLTAADGAEALEVFDAHREDIQLVLLDMRMPVMGGRETALELREREPGLPLIMSSGYDEADSFGALAPPHVFLHKPYRLQRFEDVVREVLAAAVSMP